MSVSDKKKYKILMVEDDADLCSSWVDLFTLIGHDLICYQRGMEALADLDTLKTCDLVMSDFYLPDINGVDLIQRVRQYKPGLKAILLTGSRDTAVLDVANKLPDCAILHKPINIELIENQLEELLATQSA